MNIILRHILHLAYLCHIWYLRPRSIYVVSFYFVFDFQPHFIAMNHITSLKQTHLFFVHFLEYLLLFLDDNVNEKKNE